MGEYGDFPVGVHISASQVAAVAALAGFAGQSLLTAVAVSFAENGSHDTLAQNHNTNGSVDTGLWQINSVHGQYSAAQMIVPEQNAQAAYAISSGGHDWSPWTTYKNGAFRAQMGAAQAAITQMRASGGPQAVASTINLNRSGAPLGHPGQGIIDKTGSAVSGIVDAAVSLPAFLAKLSDVGNWERVGYVVAGLLAMGFGAFAILKALGVNPPIPVPV